MGNYGEMRDNKVNSSRGNFVPKHCLRPVRTTPVRFSKGQLAMVELSLHKSNDTIVVHQTKHRVLVFPSLTS